MSSKAIYLRVSRKDLDESKQLTAVNLKYELEFPIILREKISAYAEEKQEQRIQFQKLKSLIADGSVDELYVFSVERLERDIFRLCEFFFFCEAHNCKIFSVSQDIRQKTTDEKPMETFVRVFFMLIYGFKGQEESHTTSVRTKSAIVRTNDLTFSYKKNKWGKKFVNLDGDNVEITEAELHKMRNVIMKEVDRYEKLHHVGYYPKIINKIAKDFKIKISKAYISVLKNGRYSK